MNYSMEEYARDVVFNIREICVASGRAVPDIVSESGRAVVAPHSLLVVEVFERINKRESLGQQHQPEGKAQGRHRPRGAAEEQGQARPARALPRRRAEEGGGLLALQPRLPRPRKPRRRRIALLADLRTDRQGGPRQRLPARGTARLSKLLADQYVCNFSVFQSLLDHWALKQLFPIAPLHRLNEKPTVNAILVDITCDSDGKISSFIDLQDTKDYLTLHPLNGKPYYLGVFLTGAYQDIMGDLHNLFGRVNEVHVFLEDDEPNGFYIEEALERQPHRRCHRGRAVPAGGAVRKMKAQIDAATRKDMVKPREGVRCSSCTSAQLPPLVPRIAAGEFRANFGYISRQKLVRSSVTCIGRWLGASTSIFTGTRPCRG
jgi:arginine decarboxylase